MVDQLVVGLVEKQVEPDFKVLHGIVELNRQSLKVVVIYIFILDYYVEVEQRLDQLIHVQPIFMSDYSHFLFKFLLFALHGLLVDELHSLVVSSLSIVFLFIEIDFKIFVFILILFVVR